MTTPKTKSASGEVGYGKPPRHTRFRKGQSGNPCGRPSRARAQRLKALTLQEAYRAVAVKEDGRMVPVTAMQAILRSQVELAANGNIQAQRTILAAVREIEWENEVEARLAWNRLAASAVESGSGTCEYEPDAAEPDIEESNASSSSVDHAPKPEHEEASAAPREGFSTSPD